MDRCTLTVMDVPGGWDVYKPFMSCSFGVHSFASRNDQSLLVTHLESIRLKQRSLWLMRPIYSFPMLKCEYVHSSTLVMHSCADDR